VLIQAAINGGRTREEHPAVPITPERQAEAAAAAVAAGVWTGQAAQAVRRSSLAQQCLRVLIEPAEEGRDAMTNFRQIEMELGEATTPRLLHGLDGCAWEFVALAAERGYDTRIGFEDTLTLPDGTVAPSNAAFVAAAVRISANGLPVA